jgi:integrase/recombinase XerD
VETQGLVRLLRLELECRHYAASTVREYTRLAGLFLDEHPNGVGALTRENVAKWISEGATQSRRRWRWLSLRSLGKTLVQDGLIDVDPTTRISMPQEVVVPQPIASDGDLKALLDTCVAPTTADVRDRALILLMASTGARRAEIAALRVSDVDVDLGTILIRNGKGGRSRTAFLDSQSRRALTKWFSHSGINGDDALWRSQRGRPLNGDGIRQVLARRSHRAGVHVTAHQFRRRLAAKWLLSGGSEVGLRSAAGWTSGAMVARYAALAAQQIAKVEHQRIFQ